MKKFKIIVSLFSLFLMFAYGQNCNDYENWSNCKIIIHRDYKIYMHPKNTPVDIKDTLIYNIVFNGNCDYIISLCTDQKYYPINIKLYDPATNKELYDNTKDNYIFVFDNKGNLTQIKN